MTIQIASSWEEVELLQSLRYQTYYQGGYIPPLSSGKLEDEFDGLPEAHHWYFKDQKLVLGGVRGLHISADSPLPEDCWNFKTVYPDQDLVLIGYFFVLPAYQKAGLGRQILNFEPEQLRTKIRVGMFNPEIERFLLKEGWIKLGEEQIELKFHRKYLPMAKTG